MASRIPIPWWGKIAAKVVLSRLNTNYAFWQRLRLFRHGPMDNPEYAFRVFKKHFDRSDFGRKASGFVVMEMGPGDTLGTALVAATLGASQTILVDVGPFAMADIGPYLALHDYLVSHGMQPPDIHGARNLDDVLERCRATYLTEGVESLRGLETASVDFVFSNAVYEHIRRAELEATTRETRRILRDDGAASHSIDLKDHLGGGLANLRFSDPTWESDFMSRSGFYTNRFRAVDFERLFKDAGFGVEIFNERRWEALPLARSSMAPMFGGYTDDQLLVSDIDVIARPR